MVDNLEKFKREYYNGEFLRLTQCKIRRGSVIINAIWNVKIMFLSADMNIIIIDSEGLLFATFDKQFRLDGITKELNIPPSRHRINNKDSWMLNTILFENMSNVFTDNSFGYDLRNKKPVITKA
jgi:hypothetical protein